MCTDSCSSHHENGNCCMAGTGHMRGLLKAWLLLSLSEGPAHGYQLLERLKRESAVEAVDAGLLYRTLRQFEGEGAVESTWSTGGGGPARRVYRITDLGRQHLAACTVHVRAARERLERFLDAASGRCEPAPNGRGGPSQETQ